MSIKKQITAIKSEYKLQTEQYAEKLKLLFNELIKEIFDSIENLDSFAWTQYTPSYCDGDPCSFNVYLFDFDINEKTYGEFEEILEDDELEWNKYRKNCEIISKVLSVFDDNDYLLMFGNGRKITVYKNGKIKIEEYEADY